MSNIVSILIPCFNAERWIRQAIHGALAQTWPDKEVIVIDDGSTDNSLEVIKGLGGRIRWEAGPNRGGNIARNRLLKLARGQWLQYLDADDYLLPNKVAEQMAFVEQNPETDVAFSPAIFEYCEPTSARRMPLPIPEPHDPWILLARWYLPQTGACLWRKSAIQDVGGWNNDQPCCQEHELYLRLLMAGKQLVYCPKTGAIYRQWGEHTVCKRDKPLVRQKRLEIEQRAEDFLRRTNQLTSDRQFAINQARLEMARIAWLTDREAASSIIELIRSSMPSFVPGGAAAPAAYRWLFRTLGFQAAERVAGVRRRVLAKARIT